MTPGRGLALVVVSAALGLAGCIAPHVKESDLPRATPDTGGLFSARILGHWRSPGDAACAAGPLVTRDGTRITVTHGVALTVYEIVSDATLELHTRIVQPASAAGANIVMRPEFNATSELRSFNLVLENTTTGAKETWTPCELG